MIDEDAGLSGNAPLDDPLVSGEASKF